MTNVKNEMRDAAADKVCECVTYRPTPPSIHPQLQGIPSGEERQALYRLVNSCSNYNRRHQNGSDGSSADSAALTEQKKQQRQDIKDLCDLLNTCSGYNKQHKNDASGMPPKFPDYQTRDMFGFLVRID